MRYYSLILQDPASGKAAFTAGSYPGGVYDPGALNVMFDVYTYQFAQPKGGSSLTIEGVSPTILTNAQNFAKPGKQFQIELRGGMMAGLPLANPAQAGLLFQGTIYQSFGNWLGTEINLNLVFYASSVFAASPNLVLNWTAGMPLAQALTNALTTAYPTAKIKMQIGSYVLAHDEKSFHGSMEQLATHVSEVTGGAVQIASKGGTILVYDGSYQPKPIQLQFTDFVGQPTWVDSNIIQVALVMRADLSVGSIVLLPTQLISQPGFVQTTSGSYPSMNNYQIAIKGKFRVISLRQIGNLRQPDGQAWATVINAVPVT